MMRFVAVLVVTTATSCSAPVSVMAGYQPDAAIRAQGETFYKGENVYYTTRLNQTQTQPVSARGKAVYEIEVRNQGSASDSFAVTGDAGDVHWAVTYYNALSGGSDITSQVTSTGWPTGSVPPGARVELRAEVAPKSGAPVGDFKEVHAGAASQTAPSQTDMVKAKTRLAAGTVYYCSTTGSNSNPGTFDYPWATLGYASRQLRPADTLIVMGGKYVLSQFDVDMIWPQSGAADAWITIKGEYGARPVIAGRDNLFSAVALGGASYIKLQNLEITHDSSVPAPYLYFRGGIDIAGSPSAHIVLQDLYIHHIDEMAINMQDVDDVRIINCRMEYCGFGAIGGPAGAHGGCTNVLVRGCELSYGGHYYRGGDGHDRPYDRPDGFGIEPSDGPIEIANTTAQHNYGDGLDSKSANTYIHNCIVANNSCDGIKLWQTGSRIINCLVYGTGDGVGGGSYWAGIVIDDVTHPNATFLVENVTVDDNPTRQAYPIYVQYGVGNPIDLTMRNTVVSNGYGMVYFGDSVNLTCEYNLFYRPNDAEQVYARGRTYTAAQLSELGAGNISASPLFVRRAWGSVGDYHMLAGSPGIDVGTSVGAPDVDLDYAPRPQGAGYDMGCYER